MRRRLIAAAGIVSLVGLFAIQPAGADDTAVETVVGTSGARTLLVPSAAAVSADLNGDSIAVAATEVVVDETAALGADWGVTVELCGADAGTANPDTDAITTPVKDCSENYLEHESQTTNIGPLNNSVDETDDTIEVVALDGVLNPAPTRIANQGPLDTLIEMIDTDNSEDPDTAYTATYVWSGEYKIDATGADTGTYYGFLQYTLVQ